jgi:hypothetical protein
MRLGGLLAVLLALSVLGCGIPASPADQAEAVDSVASEGVLLAEDAAAGDSTSAFVETHAGALAKSARELAQGASSPKLRQIAGRVVTALERLQSEPADRTAAAAAADELARASNEAGALAKSGG